jgi:hypothetical protein
MPSSATELRHVDDDRGGDVAIMVNTVYHPASRVGDVPST